MKHTMKRVLALAIALMLAIPGIAFADDPVIGGTAGGETAEALDFAAEAVDLPAEDLEDIPLEAPDPAFPETQEPADAPAPVEEPDAASPFEQAAEIDGLRLTVAAEAGAFPEGSTLRVEAAWDASVAAAAEAALGGVEIHRLYRLEVLDGAGNPCLPDGVAVVRVEGLSGFRAARYDAVAGKAYALPMDFDAEGETALFPFVETAVYDLATVAEAVPAGGEAQADAQEPAVDEQTGEEAQPADGQPSADETQTLDKRQAADEALSSDEAQPADEALSDDETQPTEEARFAGEQQAADEAPSTDAAQIVDEAPEAVAEDVDPLAEEGEALLPLPEAALDDAEATEDIPAPDDPFAGESRIEVTTLTRADAMLAANQNPGTEYIDAEGKSQNQDATVLTVETTEWTDGASEDMQTGGWYVANKEIIFSEPIIVSGDVHLILANRITVKAEQGIRVPEGSSLTIYAQSTASGMGKLVAAADGDAGIGGASSTVTINGGDITASGSVGVGGAGGTVTINGGKITASGEVGIGGASSTVEINGGSVEATGDGAGIGGGAKSVTIAGSASVRAAGGDGGVGIGADDVPLSVGEGLYVYDYKAPNITDPKKMKPIDNIDGVYTRTRYMTVIGTEPALAATLDEKTRYYNDDNAVNQWIIKGGELKLYRDIKLVSGINDILLGSSEKQYALDLNGWGLIYSKADASPAITVMSGATLEMTTDSAPTKSHRYNRVAADDKLAVVGSSGSYSFTGGYITGGASGGVRVLDGGVFTMSAGTIIGNVGEYGGGVYVSGGGTFTLSGGAIIGNKATVQGSGVYPASSSAFELSGSPVIADNDGDNVYLIDGNRIVITGALDQAASVGVTMQTNGVFTKNYGDHNSEAPSTYFTSDATGVKALKAILEDSAPQAKLGVHVHEYSVKLGDDVSTLVIACANSDCGHEGDLSFTLALNAPTQTVYGGEGSPEATLDAEALKAANEALKQNLSQNDILYFKAEKGDEGYTATSEDPLGETPTDAGDYIARLPIPEIPDPDIKVNVEFIEVGYTISKKPVSITGISIPNKTYDGNTEARIDGKAALEGVLEADLDGVTLVTLNGEAAEAAFEDANAAKGKAVTITGYALEGDRAVNYELSQPEGLTADIEPLTAELSWNYTSLTYTGGAQKPHASVSNLIDDDTCPVTVTGDQTFAGSYTATASALTNSNYALPENNTRAFTIAPKPVGLEWGDASLTYTGAAQKPEVTPTGLIGKDTCEVTLTIEGKAADDGKAISVGDYTATATGLSNKNYALPEADEDDTPADGGETQAVDLTKDFTIAPKTVGLEWDATTFIYDAMPHAPKARTTGLIEGDACDVTEVTVKSEAGVEGEATAVGRYTATATALSNANYALPEGENAIEFQIGKKYVTLEWTDTEFTYDGQSHTPTAKVKAEDLIGDESCEATVTGGQTNAGSYTATVTELSNANYMLTEEDNAQAFTIIPKPVRLSWADINLTYNGSTQQPTASATGLIEGDTCTVTVSGGQRNAGSYTATATGLSNKNYTLSDSAETTQDYTIGQKTVGLTWKNTSLTYNAKEQQPTAEATGRASGDTCTVTVTGAAKDAGSYTATATALSNGNYALPAEATQAFTIAPKTVGLSWTNTSFTYDGQSHAPTATATSVIDGDTCTVTVTGATKDAGSYTATASALSNGNYALPNSKTKTFTIGKKAVELEWEDASFTYDGQNHAPVATAKGLIEGDTCEVTVSGAAKGAGDHTANASALSNANYVLPSEKTHKYTIAQKTVGLTWTNTNLAYSGKTQQPTASATGLIEGDTCTVTVSGGQKNIGSFTATATKLSNGNYALPEAVTQAYTIGKKTVGLTWSNTSLTYNGQEQQPTLRLTGVASGDTCTATVTGAAKDAGSHTATVTALSNDNYALPSEATKAFTIAQKAVKLSWGAAAFTYDGQEHAPTATATGLIEGDACAVTVTGAAKDAGSHTATASALSNGNYALPTSKTKAFTIGKKTVGLAWTETAFIYDGQEHVPAATATELASGDTCTVTVTGAQTKAGSFTARASALSNANYALPTEKSQAFTIGQRTVGLTWANTELTYNGKSQQPTATATNLVGSDTCTVTVTGGQTNVGSYTATATKLSNANYALPEANTTAFTISATPTQTAEPTTTANPGYTLLAQLKASGSTALKLTWTKAAGADGYDIFLRKTGKGKASVVASVDADAARSYKLKGLKKGTTYEVYVRAWASTEGIRAYIGKASPSVYAIAGNYTKKQANPKKVAVKASKVTLAVGEKHTIKASVTGVKSGRSVLARVKKLRYYSSDRNVAKVTSKGIIRAVGAGSCTIYVIANNGVRAKVKVSVESAP